MSKSFLSLFSNTQFRAKVTRVLGDLASPEDTLQVLAEKQLEKESSQVQNASYWLRAAKNAAIDINRSETSRRENETRAAEHIPVEAHSPEQTLSLKQEVALIEAALQSLPPLTRQMFVMHFKRGWSQSKIAVYYDVSVSTVEKKLKSARQHCLKHLLDQEN